MAKKVEYSGTWVLPSRYKREQPQPVDYSSYFDSLQDATDYAAGLNTEQGIAYIGQIISVKVDETKEGEPIVKLYKIADSKGTLKPIYDEDNIGSAIISGGVDFKGAFPTTATAVKKGYMYIATATKTYGSITVEKNDYLLAKEDLNLPANPTQTDIEKFVILEQNLTGAITNINVTGSGNYVKSVNRNGQNANQLDVNLGTLPTPPKPLLSITKQYGKLNGELPYDTISKQGAYAEYPLHSGSNFVPSVLDNLPFDKVDSSIANSWFSVKLNGVELEAAYDYHGEDYSTIDHDYTVVKLAKSEYVVVFSSEISSILSEDDLIAVTYCRTFDL